MQSNEGARIMKTPKSAGTIVGEHVRKMQVTLPEPHNRPGAAAISAAADRRNRETLLKGNADVENLRNLPPNDGVPQE